MTRKPKRSASRTTPKAVPARTPARTSWLRSTLLAWGPLLGIVLVVRIAVAEPYHIPSGSMIPTLLPGDWLYVNNARFGGHIPFTRVHLPGYAEPARGDVVVFVSPPQVPEIRITPRDVTPTLVKRIVGIADDTLFMRNGRLFVNGTRERRDVIDTSDTQPLDLFSWQHEIEIQGSRFGAPPAAPTTHNWGPLVVPRGTYFMMGDNRDDSVDSRYYGLVPRANVRGTPMFVYYSYDTVEGRDYFRALTEIRWSRIGTRLR